MRLLFSIFFKGLAYSPNLTLLSIAIAIAIVLKAIAIAFSILLANSVVYKKHF